MDPRAELRAGLIVALSDTWGLELTSSLAGVRDLSRTVLPAPDPAFDYDGVLPAFRIGLGFRWSLTRPREEAEAEDADAFSSDPGDYQRGFL